MSKAKRKTDYLFKRNGSQFWRVRFQMDGRSVETSLGTTDRQEAEIAALPMIAGHKQRLLARRPRFVTSWWYEYEPGREHALPDGTKIIATDKELIYIGQDGSIIRTEPNGAPQYSHPTRLKEPSFELFDRERARAPLAKKDADDAILETYLSHRNITGYNRREAETVWAIYKKLTNSKPLKDADREDGRTLVRHFQEQGNKRATITKKVGWLRAAVELAIDEDKEGKLKFNPFSNIIPDGDDEQDRVPLDAADMKACKRNLDKLSESDQLLFRLLATTGMRLSEAYQIDSEKTERGARYCIVGTKTDQSLRRVPFPTGLLPYLPKKVTGPLFGENTRRNHQAASKRLNRFLNDCGIVDRSKVAHSLRHRAKDRARAARCPWAVQEELFGRDKVTVGHDYGLGSPVPLLKEWIDKIGF